MTFEFQPADNIADVTDPSLFPHFTDAQVRFIAERTHRREYEQGEVVFRQGETRLPFLFILTGSVVFFDRDDDSHYHSRVEAGGFVGDISMFTGAAAIATCVVAEPTEVLIGDRDALHALVSESPDLGDLLLTTMLARRAWLESQDFGNLTIVGTRSAELARLRDYLQRNQVSFEWHDPSTDPASRQLLDGMAVDDSDLPVVVSGNRVLRQAEVRTVAQELGFVPELRTAADDPYDVVVVGAGPSGLAAAVYAASEGLSTLVLDDWGPGGQAGTSSKIENYLGFATGISGTDLARQAVIQARKFGATLSTPCSVAALERDGDLHVVVLTNGERVVTRFVVLATGARYRRLEVDRLEHFEGAGIFYAARASEVMQCEGDEVLVVGAGNSAGQAAMSLSRYARRVHVAVRGDDLSAGMSDYLVRRLQRSGVVDVHLGTTVTALHGDDRIEAVTLTTAEGDRVLPVSAIFLMIGAVPRTDCLEGADDIVVDAKGFVLTGASASVDDDEHVPLYLETSRPGVLAIGDVRSGSVKRVASAVGEGAMAVTLIHELLRRDPVLDPAEGRAHATQR